MQKLATLPLFAVSILVMFARRRMIPFAVFASGALASYVVSANLAFSIGRGTPTIPGALSGFRARPRTSRAFR